MYGNVGHTSVGANCARLLLVVVEGAVMKHSVYDPLYLSGTA